MYRLGLTVALLIAPTFGPVVADTVVTNRAIRAGDTITADAITVSPATMAGAISDPKAVIGMQAAKSLFPGRAIFEADLQQPNLIEKNQVVTVVYSRGGLNIYTEGRTLDGGVLGDLIRVMNLESRKTIVGKIQSDGSIAVGGE